jgi:hypothetical protein
MAITLIDFDQTHPKSLWLHNQLIGCCHPASCFESDCRVFLMKPQFGGYLRNAQIVILPLSSLHSFIAAFQFVHPCENFATHFVQSLPMEIALEDLLPKTVKLTCAAESAQSPTPSKIAKVLQLNAANVTDPRNMALQMPNQNDDAKTAPRTKTSATA